MAASKSIGQGAAQVDHVADVGPGVDRQALASALADHAKALKNREAFYANLNVLRDRCAELDVAIFDLEAMQSDKPDADLDIEGIKAFADEQTRYQNQITALVKVRTCIEKQIKAADERVITLAIADASAQFWRVIYAGLLPTFDRNLLEQLFAAGSLINKTKAQVMDDLSLSDNYEQQIPAMIKQFNIPMGV